MSFNKARKTIEWHNEGHQLSQWAKADYGFDSQHNNYEITGNGNPTTIEGLEEEYNRVGWKQCTECNENELTPYVEWRLVSDDYDEDQADDSEWNLETVGHIGKIYPMAHSTELSCLSGGGEPCFLCLETITGKWAVDEGCPHIQIKENGKWVTKYDFSYYG